MTKTFHSVCNVTSFEGAKNDLPDQTLYENLPRYTTLNLFPLFIAFSQVKSCSFGLLRSIYVFSYFPFGFEGRMWDLIVSVLDHCLSFYLSIISVIADSVE